MIDTAQLAATITFADAIRQRWDVLVIGGGPAGAIAARETARQGARVLLVDRGQFPRPKVCGGCLNAAGWGLLTQAGLGDLPCLVAAAKVREFCLACRGKSARLPLDGGLAVPRERLDTELILAAIDAGAEFLDSTRCTVEKAHQEHRQVRLAAAATSGRAVARAVVIAAGLGGRNLALSSAQQSTAARTARIGVGAMLGGADHEFPVGRITMACDRNAYAGIVQLEDGRLDVAAAVDAAAVRRLGGLAQVVENTFRESGVPLPRKFADARWSATPRLTHRRSCLSGERCFAVGDAAAYIEPFTGEGIAWALASGLAVAPHVLQVAAGSSIGAYDAWNDTYRHLLGKRMRRCRVISLGLRHPWLVRTAIGLLSRKPELATPVVRALATRFVAGETA